VFKDKINLRKKARAAKQLPRILYAMFIEYCIKKEKAIAFSFLLCINDISTAQ
jgi:hypothetical protein